MLDPVQIFPYLVLGIVSGLLAGLFGIGGGLVIVPALAVIFKGQGFPDIYIMHMAVATSLATISVTGIASSYSHYRHHAVLWPVTMRLLPGIIVGTLAGALIAEWASSLWLKYFYCSFAVAVGAQMALEVQPRTRRHLPAPASLGLVGSVIGVVSALVGIGGGTMTTPYLVWRNVPIGTAIGTSAACGVPIAIVATASYWYLGGGKTGMPPWTSGYIYWPAFVCIVATSVLAAPVGAASTHRMNAAKIRRLFALLLVLTAIRLVTL